MSVLADYMSDYVQQHLKVEDQLPHRSKRIQNLPLATFEPPLPPQRRRIDITGFFKPTGLIDIFGEQDLTRNIVSAPITTKIEDLQAKGFVIPFNPPLTKTNILVVVQIPDQREQVDTSYHIFRGLVMDDLAPTI